MVCKGFHECHSSRVKLKGCNDCLIITNESKPTVEENNISYAIENRGKQTLLKYKVDDGIISGTDEIRCDYLMMFPDCAMAFYIEIKSQGWKKALDQLDNTVRLLQPEMNTYTPHLRAVVRRGAPNAKYVPLMNMRKRIKNQYSNATVEVKTRFFDEV